MNEVGFQEWLIAQGQARSSVQTRISDLRRLEHHFGDLDAAFDRDRFGEILGKLHYTAADRNAGKSNESGVSIDGDIYNGLATCRSALSLYAGFRTESGGVRILSQADRIRQFVLTRYANPARDRGEEQFSVRAGDIHGDLGLSNAMPAVCAALDGDKFARLARVLRLSREGPANSSTVIFTFRFDSRLVLDRGALEHYKRLFVKRYPDFEPLGFLDGFSRYFSEEREYKDRLIELARQAREESNGGDPAALGARLLDVLQAAGAPGSLLDWRTNDHLMSLRKKNPGILEAAVGRLAQTESVEDGVAAFVEIVWPLLADGLRSKPYSESRNIPTMLVALLHPDQAYGINSAPASRVFKALLGRQLFGANPLTRQEYRDVLALATSLRNVMDKEWRWSPRDLWDVQGFIWAVSRAEKSEAYEGVDMPLTREAVLRVIDECDQITVQGFLGRYGFGKPRSYWIAERGRRYPCKAVVNVANGNVPGGDVVRIGAAQARNMAEQIGFSIVDDLDADRNGVAPTNLILYGPPGTGKTYQTAYEAVRLCRGSAPDDRDDLMDIYSSLVRSGRIEFVTFHQSFSYEEFVEGLRPAQFDDGGGPAGFHLRAEPGVFRRIAERAEASVASGQEHGAETPPEQFVLVIDEINRANVSKVFGELITLVEPDKRIGADNEIKVRLPYSREMFGVPANLHIVGTMNTADRSIALLDTALRRRFEFRELMPDASMLASASIRTGVNLETLLATLNERVEYLFDREHQIGHAYFMNCASRQDVDDVMRTKVIPLLAEYFFEDWSKVALVLGDRDGAGRFIARTSLRAPDGMESDGAGQERFRWTVLAEFAADAYAQFA